MTKVGFRIEGEFLTSISRARVIEGRFDHGYEILYDGLEGISHEQVMSVLRGDAYLTGVNDVDIVYSEDPEWKAELDYFFAGTWQSTASGRYYRPYAWVSCWGSDDNKEQGKITPDSDSVQSKKRKGEFAGCSLFYADQPERDVLKILSYRSDHEPGIGMTKDGRRHILWKEYVNFPYTFYKVHRDPQKALDDYLAKVGGIQERGNHLLYPKETFTCKMEVDEVDANRPSLPSTVYGSDDARKFGIERAEAIDAEGRGMSVEEYRGYWELASRKSDGPNVEHFFKAIDRASEIRNDEKTIEEYRRLIAEQAGDAPEAWVEVEMWNKKFQIPKAPLENWALWRGDGVHLAPKWDTICPSGLGMLGDDPFHTDCIVGAGFDLDAKYNSDLVEVFTELRHKIQEEVLGFEIAVLCGEGIARALKVVHPAKNTACKLDEVAIIPNAGPDYVEAAMTAGAIITERGGAMAHLVTASRERNVKIVRVKDARKLLTPGMTIDVDCSKGKLSIPVYRQDYKMKLFGQIIDVDNIDN